MIRSGIKRILHTPTSCRNLLVDHYRRIAIATIATTTTTINNNDDDTEPPTVAWKVAASKKSTAIFPWRHESNLDNWIQEGRLWGPTMPSIHPLGMAFLTHATASQTLPIPWYELPFSGWKQELADSSSWAFSQAVAGILSNTYQVPVESMIKEGEPFDVDFQHTIITASNSHETEVAATTNSHEESINLDDMVAESLKELYQSAHESGRQNLQITLQIKPVGAQFNSCSWVPYMTRQQVKDNPSLKRALYNLRDTIERELVTMETKPSTLDYMKVTMRELDDFSRRQTIDYDDYSSVESTIVILVIVECDEIFSVIDLETSNLLQGHADNKIRRVKHVVRLEQVVNWVMHDYHGFHLENGPWQITDWDDLLKGNIFFL